MTRLGPVAVSLVAVAALLLGGCGEEAYPADPSGPAAEWSDPPAAKALEARVLYDDVWTIEEGVWSMVQEGGPWNGVLRAFRGQSNGLLGAHVRGAMVVNAPGLYGNYRTRVELLEARPDVPAWCEDVVEVSFHTRGGLQLGSFEWFEEPWDVPAGDYRVRECVTGLDQAETEDEFDGDDYHTYTGRHLFQLWPAQPAPDEVVKVGSRFAARAHRDMTT